jgi:hypothetical protein
MPISPSSIDNYIFGSEAERTIYNFAVKEGSFHNSDRYLFHALSIVKTGNKKIKGEIDFVYMDTDCILFLEVKGGEVRYDSQRNDWYTMGGTVKGDPFKQAYDALYQVRDELLINLFGSSNVKNRLVYGIGVLFPECIKPALFEKRQISNMEYDPLLIYDYNDIKISRSFTKYIEKLKAYWSGHLQYSGREGVSGRELQTISNFFRRDLHFRLPGSDLIKKSTEQVMQFTSRQMFALDMLQFNEAKGGIVAGGPGTGKTVLALELLRRSIMAGKKTLFICYNKNLIEYLAAKIKEESLVGTYEMRHLHGLLRDPAFVDSPLGNVEAGDEYWFKKLPLLFSKNLKSQWMGFYDYLIIDEGQDILNEYQIEALGKLITGNLEGGHWAIFLDNEYQDIYNKDSAEYFQYLRDAYSTIYVPLLLNCRNTTSTIDTAALQSGLPKMPCMRTSQHWSSKIRYYNTDKELFVKINEELVRLEAEGIDKKKITILCSERSQVAQLTMVLHKISHESAITVSDKINVLTIHSFKGLENEFILIWGPSYYDPANLSQMKLIYIANTRACSQSVFFLSRKYKELLEDNILL